MLKKLKLKKEKRKLNKEKSTEMQKPNVEAEVYNNNKKYDLEKKKKLKSLIGFHSANKIKTTRVGGKEREKKNPKKLKNK